MHDEIRYSKKKRRRWKKRVFFGILCFLTIIFVGGLIVLHTPKFKSFVFSKIKHRLQTDAKLSITASSFDFNVFRLSATFEDFKIIPLAPEDSILESFVARKLNINLSSVTLRGQKIHIQKLHVTEPKIQLNQKKSASIPEKAIKPSTNKSLSIRIDDFKLDSGLIDYQNEEYPLAAAIRDISVVMIFQKNDGLHKGKINSSSGEIKLSEAQISLEKFLTEFTFDDQSIQITRFFFETNPFFLDASGEIDNYQQQPRYRFALQGNLDLAFLKEFLSEGQNFEGDLSLKTSITGEGSDLEVEGHIQGREILLADIPLKKLEGNFKGDRTHIALGNLDIEDSKGTLEGNLILSLLEKGESSAILRWSSIKLSLFERWIPHLTPLLFTETNGRISAKWREFNPDSINADGDINFESLPRVSLPQQDPMFLKGHASFHAADGVIELFPSSLVLDNTTISVSGKIDRTKRFMLRYQLKSENLADIERLLTHLKRAGRFPALKDLPSIQIGGQFFLKGEAQGTFEKPTANLAVTGNNISLNTMKIQSLEAELGYAEKQINVQGFTIRKGEGILEGSLGLDLKKRNFNINLEGKSINLSSFQILNPEEGAVSGSIFFKLEGNGTVTNPVFSLRMVLEDFTGQNVSVESLTLNVESDGRIIDLKMESPLGKTSVKAKLVLEEPYLIQGQLKTESIDIWHTIRSGLEPLPSPIASQVSAEADFVIPLRDWKNSTLSLNLLRSSFRYKDLTILSQLPIVVKIQDHELIIEEFSLKGPQTEFSVSGRMPLKEEHRGNINLNGSINLRILEALLPGTEASGLLNIEGSLSGSLAEPVLNASVEMENGQLASSFIPLNFHDITLKSEIKENVLHLDQLSIGVSGGNISAAGQIFLGSLLPGNLSDEDMTRIQAQNEIMASLSELNLDNFTEILSDELEMQLGGRIDGTVRFHGDLTSLSHLKMDGELTRLEFSLDEFKMSNEEKILFGMREGLLHLTKFRLSGGQSFLQAECELSLFPDAQIDARLSASLDSAVLSPLLVDTILGGNLSFDLQVQGDLTSPVVSGLGKISDGFYQMEDPPFLVTNVDGTIDFPDTETVALSLEGIANGGSTNIQGRIVYRSFAIVSTRFEMKADKVQLNYPEGFQAILDGTLLLEKREKEWSLGGEVKITQSYYNSDIYPGGQLINTLRTRRRAFRNDIPPRIRSLNLDIDLSTVDAFVIENNLVDLELDGNIRVSGTVFDPRLSGFVRSRQTGQIVFGNHEYEVEQASLDFQDADPFEGQLSITGHTQIPHTQLSNSEEDLKVTLIITGTITNLAFGLSSSPAYPEIELASLLITGYGTESFRDDAAGVIGDQLMLYFLSPFATPFTNIVKNFLRAEEISIEPINIASEEDPGARFTFRKGLIHTLDLIYSTDISNTQNQTWVLDYNFSKNLFLQSFAKDDGSYGGSFSHRFFLGSQGGGKKTLVPLRYKQFRIKDIHFEGDLIFPKSDLSRLSRSLKKGSVFSYKELRKTINNLEAFYKAKKYLNVVIKSLLQQDNSDSITIVFNITPLSPVAIAFEGDPLSKKLKREVIAKWNGRLPEEMSVSQVKKQFLRDLNGKGHLDARVSYTKNNTNGKSVYAFSASLGPKYRIRNFTIDGQSFISPKAIKAAVSGIPKAKGKGLWVLLSDFKRAKLRIETLLAEYGYQNAVISRPQILFDRDKNVIDITLPIDQGIQSRISSIQITGNSVFTDFDLTEAMSLKEGTIFSPTYLATDTNRLYSFYRSQGFHDVKIDVRELFGPDETSLDLLYTIQEGEIHTISSIEVRGNRRTPAHVIRRELTFKEGNILRTGDMITSQKNLYNLMIFRMVHIRREDSEGQRERPKILVEVQEDPRFAVSYGLRYNSEEKLEGFGQLDLINILGRGSNGMFFYRQNDRQKDYRFSLQDPYLFGRRFNTLYSFFYTEETFFDFKEEVWGLSIQQQLQVTRHSTFSYLFRINNTRSYTLDTDNPFSRDITFFLPEFQIFWLRDTRTSLLNAKNGSFLSLSLTYSPEFLNTTLKYIGFFGQYSLYVPISKQIVWASNYRIGLADAFDQYLMPSSRRFLAGGANSVRGFERDTVGPYSPFLEIYTGGEALFVMNQELRFPFYKWLEGVAFFDVGNVYENLGDFNPLDVRTGAGFGLRLYLSGIFLRLDYGINLASREYEKKSIIYFSIGQAF